MAVGQRPKSHLGCRNLLKPRTASKASPETSMPRIARAFATLAMTLLCDSENGRRSQAQPERQFLVRHPETCSPQVGSARSHQRDTIGRQNSLDVELAGASIEIPVVRR